MTTCNRCGSTSVELGKTKAGHPMLVEVRRPIPHSVFCGARSKPLKKVQANKVEPSQGVLDAIAGLMDLGWKVREATAAVNRVWEDGTRDAAELLTAALKAADKEMDGR